MKMRRLLVSGFVCSLLAATTSFAAGAGHPARVACVGDSITFGSGIKDRDKDSYPAKLGQMLGDAGGVKNFGVSGATLLNDGDKPYQKQHAFKDALQFEPNVVVIMLGTNDTKPQNWKHKDEFEADYKNLIGQFKSLPSHPEVFVCLPPPVPGKGNYGINEQNLDEQMPMIKEVAQAEHVHLINIYDALKDKPQLLPDRVHPNAEGAQIMAKTVDRALTGKSEGSH